MEEHLSQVVREQVIMSRFCGFQTNGLFITDKSISGKSISGLRYAPVVGMVPIIPRSIDLLGRPTIGLIRAHTVFNKNQMDVTVA